MMFSATADSQRCSWPGLVADNCCTQAVQAQLRECDCTEDTDAPASDGGTGELEQLREAVHVRANADSRWLHCVPSDCFYSTVAMQVIESASETYEEKKKCLEEENAQMLTEIHEFECIRSKLKEIVKEETALLAEQASDDSEQSVETADQASGEQKQR